MRGGLTTARTEGTPQGGPLSPLLSNILLDDLDKELKRRGHAFCRYADDCNIYVRTRRAGARVMSSMCRFLAERLRLTVNLAKSAVDRSWKRSFLGFSVTAHREPRLKVAAKSIGRLRDELRDLFRQGRGRSIGHTAGSDRAPEPRRLMQRGRKEERAWASANNERGPWNAGASHMNDAFRSPSSTVAACPL